MNQEHVWHTPGLLKIFFFLQPLSQLKAYNRFNNHSEFMGQNDVNYSLLTPLQDAPIGSLSDRIDKKIEFLNGIYRQTLFRAVWGTFRTEFLYYFTIVQLCVIIKISVPFVLSKLLDQLNGKSEQLIQLVLILSILLFCQVLFEQHYFQNIYQFSIKLRHSIVGMIYKRISNVPYGQSSSSKGQIFNIITMDLAEIDSGLTWFIALSGSIIVGIFGTIQLYTNIGIGCFAGLAALIGVNFLQQNIIAFQKESKQKKNIHQDQRTRLVGEILSHIRSLKMFATEHIYRNELIDLREKQDEHTRKILFFDTISQLLSGNISVIIAMIIMQSFGTSDKNSVYSSLWVLQLIKVWCLTYFYRGRKFWVNMQVLNKRVSEILEMTVSVKVITKKSKGFQQVIDEEEISLPEQFLKISIDAKDYSGHWQEGGFKLQDITFSWQQNQLIGIIGQVGSGKTTLLQALLGEINKINGSIQVQGSVSYVEQTPFIFPGTIQQNILFGNALDQNKYKQAITLSQLTQDLQYKGDQFQVGDRGTKLSGGQRARLSLARAIYSDSQILLLDDILSAVDTRVAQKIFQEGILPLIDQGKTIVMVTHQTQLVKFFNQIVLMENGKITKQGNPTELSEYIQEVLNVKDEEVYETDQTNDQDQNEEMQENLEELEQLDNQNSQGSLDLYNWYIQEAGGTKVLGFIILSYLIDASLNLGITKAFGQGYSLLLILILGIIYAITTIIKLNLVYQRTLTAIQNMHRKLCTSVTRAETRILDQSNIGQLLSRFTSDLNNVEGMVLLDSHWVLEGCTDNILIVLIACTQNIYTVIAAVTFLVWMLTMKTNFSNAMKYSTKCDDISRGNLLNFIEASINGSTLIRTYKKVDYFHKQMLDLIYMNMQSYFMFLRLNATLAFTFEMSLHLFIIFILFSITLIQKEDASNAGFNLFILLSLGYMFSLNLRGQIYLDIDMQNVQRVRTSIDIPKEGLIEHDKDEELIEKWPNNGRIEFKNVSLTYQKSLKLKRTYALKNISFIIQPGWSVGIVGRTGAGKSSIISTLFRLHEIDSGTIYYDGIDIDSIGLHTLRERIQVIPQSAPLLSVSVRKNLDPKRQFNDQTIWDAIKKVGLEGKISQLDQIIDDGILSAGEKQLFMFARLILRQSCKILVLDEATSNVDLITDKFINQVLQDYFSQTTKIIIAHRLQTILHCDRVLVLDDGSIIQYDHPKKLINDHHSKGFRSMVLALEPQQRNEIINLLQQ